MANSPRNSLGNVRSDMDITYPEHLSRLHRHSVLSDHSKSYYNPKKNTKNRRGNRYRTQPVTFDEIQEVDEESMVIDAQKSDDITHPMSASLSTSKLELDFYSFTKSFGAKMKKQDSTGCKDISATANNRDQSNGIQPVHGLPSKLGDQRRWTDYAREGSV